ncbi:hypothetical protein BDW72DRAFT_205593 [Aspergillus terricola var. indicus]
MSPSKVDRQDLDEVPILIIGSGPFGLLLAYMLAKLNIQTLLAHALSPRSLEICRQFDLDVNKIRMVGTSRKGAYWVNFITNLCGGQVGRLPYERMDPGVLDSTPTMIHNIPQPAFEDLVAMELSKSTLVDMRKNHSFVRLEQRRPAVQGHVLTTVEDRSAGREYIVKSTHFLGVECEGEDSYETMMTIPFNADLRPVVGDRVGMLHWIMDPEAAGFIISYDLSGNQVLICNSDTQKYPPESWDEALCRKTINAAIGKEIEYDVLSYRPWILRDVHNLAYKLAATHQGWGGDRLLHSYQADRRQVALVNSKQSVKNGQKIFGLLKSIGTTDSRDSVEVARQNLYRNLQDPEGSSQISHGIEQREHFDNLRLHIGYVYGDPKIPDQASLFKAACNPGARLPHAWIHPLAPLQCRIQQPPIDSSYVWELSQDQVKAKQYSTLDLCGFDRFTLLVNSTSVGKWKKILQEVRNTFLIAAPTDSALKLDMAVLNVDFQVDTGSQGAEWVKLMRLNEGQATLVRPDQQILACFEAAAAGTDIFDAIKSHLDW